MRLIPTCIRGSGVLSLCVALAACNDKVASTSAGSAPAQGPTASASTLAPWPGDLASLEPSQLCAIDAVNGITSSNNRVQVNAAEAVTVEGWAATGNLQAPASVDIVLEGPTVLKLSGGAPDQTRDDVAKAYASAGLARSGFKLVIPSSSLPAGEYKLHVVHAESGGERACATPLTVVAK